VSDIIFNQLNRIVNVPKSHVYGAELEAIFSPLDGLSIQMTGAYLKTEIDEYVGYDEFGIVTNFAGKGFNYTPKVQLSSVLSYRRDISENLNARFTVAGRYSGKQKGDLVGDSRFAIKSYAVLDANLQVSTNDEKYTLELWAKNLTDKYYWSSTQFQTDSIARYAAMPRTWGASLTVNF
jgi:iron complex outermembrane recepter protein